MKSAEACAIGQFASFVRVGAAGFFLDAALFFLLTNYFHWSVLWARTLSATCSITSTWALNRRYTFPESTGSPHWEYARYVIAQILGLAINLGVFASCFLIFSWPHDYPLLALALGAVAATTFNFFSARSFAYIHASKQM